MKKFLYLMTVTAICFAMICLPLFLCASCKTAGRPSLLGTVKNVLIGDDYESAGKTFGEACYMGYLILEGNPKYKE